MKKFVSLLISLLILALMYWQLSKGGKLEHLGEIFRDCDRFWMVVSLGMVVPLTLFTSWRLQQLMPGKGQLSFAEANRLILVASVLNLILPSKMGDIAKAYFMRDRGQMSGTLALSLVVFEKTCDMLSLLLWCVFGLAWVKLTGGEAMAAFRLGHLFERDGSPGFLLAAAQQEQLFFWAAALVVGGALMLGLLLIGSPRSAHFFFGVARRIAPKKVAEKLEKLDASWSEMHAYFWASKTRLAKVSITSVFIWFLHLLQIWLFVLALRAWIDFTANLAISPLAILAGLIPLGLAGVGTRDAALIFLYSPYLAQQLGDPAKAVSTAAALGLLCTARYLLPALGGLPFVTGYLRRVKAYQAEERALAGTRT